MKSVIIIYSKTGNTLSVANRLKEKMKSEILEVKAVSNDPNETKPKLTQLPDVTNYSHLVFASPVHGFSLSKVMETYLKQLPDLSGKTIDLFITHFFPFAWMGGTRTLKQMKTIIESKNGVVMHMTSVNWKSRKRDLVIEQMIKAYSDEKTL